MAKVSVIIPTYHRSSSIGRALDSVLSQTLTEIEVIVVDDNGIETDEGQKTASVMKQYCLDSRVHYIRHETNMNGAAARNTGIKESKGEYISFLDDDDVYLPERLMKMSSLMDSLPDTYGACYSSYVKIMPNGKEQRSAETASGDVFVQALMRSLYIGSGSNLFFRKKTVDKVGLFDESFRRNQDLEYLLRVLKIYQIAHIDEVLLKIYYDIRTVSFSYQQSLDREITFRQKFDSYLKELPEKTQKKVVHMYDLDWARYLLASNHYSQFIKHIIKSRVPFTICFRYFLYLLNRFMSNTSYGFYY